MIVKEVGLSYSEIMWKIPWAVILRMLADLPRQVKEENGGKKKEMKKLTPQTANDFRQFIKQANQKAK